MTRWILLFIFIKLFSFKQTQHDDGCELLCLGHAHWVRHWPNDQESPHVLKSRIQWLMSSSFLHSSPDSIVFLVRLLSLCRHVLIRPLVMFMYKQHIPVGETGVQSRIQAQLCSWKVRGRWKEGGERKRIHSKWLEDSWHTKSGWEEGGGKEESNSQGG